MALSEQQTLAIRLIVDGHTYRAVAREAGCELVDLATWAADEEYSHALAAARGSQAGEVRTVLEGRMVEAVATGWEVLAGLAAAARGAEKESDRIRAAAEYMRGLYGLLDRSGYGPSQDVTITRADLQADADAMVMALSEEEVMAMDALLEKMRNGGHEH